MKMHLRYDMMSADLDCGENRHPQKVMRELGIEYQHATPQSIADQWWFWNCNVPLGLALPPYLEELGVKPHEAIGMGLDAETADELEDNT